MTKIAGRRRVVVGENDPTLTPCAGLGLVAELDRVLGAQAALDEGCDFEIAAKRNPAAWAAVAKVPERAWSPAAKMADAEVAVCGYRPAGWPAQTRCVVRRVRVDGADIGRDGRVRRRRTIAPGQLALVHSGEAEHTYAYTFIMTSLDWLPVLVEWHFRQRAQVEERIKDTKGGMALRHLPSGKQAVNKAWMCSAFLATNISVWLQSLGGTDRKSRSHGKPQNPIPGHRHSVRTRTGTTWTISTRTNARNLHARRWWRPTCFRTSP